MKSARQPKSKHHTEGWGIRVQASVVWVRRLWGRRQRLSPRPLRIKGS